MKGKSKLRLIILMIIVLSLLLVACSNKPVISPTVEEEYDDYTPIISTNKNQLLKKISTGMTLGSQRMEEMPERHVSSVYTIHTGYINYTVEYKANYSTKLQNSEIYARIFDNNEHMNRVFIYYNKGDLYFQLEGERKSVKDFGMTSLFDVFYEMVTMLDMSDKLIGEGMAGLFNPDNTGKNIGALVDQSRITYIKVSEVDERESIEMTDINFGYGDIIPSINRMIVNTLGPVENKFDLLSLKYLGLRISDLGRIEIASLRSEKINIWLDNKCVNTVIVNGYGDRTDGINDFTIDMEVTAKPGKQKIFIDDTESPYLNNYSELILGRVDYGGTLFIPFVDMVYNAELRAVLSSTDNTRNQVVFTLTTTKLDNATFHEEGGFFYKDQMMYVDIKGIDDLIQGAIELKKLNLPRVKFANLDLAQEITLLINDLLKIVQSFKGGDDYGQTKELAQIALENIVSNEQDKTISLTVTQELIQQLYGEEVDLFDLIAQKMGITADMLAQIVGDDALKDARLVLIYNVETGAIGIDLYSGENLLFQLRLHKIPPLNLDIIPYPPSFNPDNYHWLEIPNNTILSLRGTLDTVGETSVDFDQLFGALLGDISGINTPYKLYSYEQLEFVFDIMQLYEYEEDSDGIMQRSITKEMKFELYKGGEFLLGVYSANDPNYLLVHFNFPIGPKGEDREGVPYDRQTVKYRIRRDKVRDAFDEFLGPGNIFSTPNAMDMLTRLLRVLDESISMRLRFEDSSLSFNLIPEKVYEFIGLENLTAIVKARVGFAMSPEEYLNINIIEDEFVTPTVVSLANEENESIYCLQWQEYVYTFFGDKRMRFKLSYEKETIEIVSGKNHYKPSAKLLDTVVSYNIIITDTINGTKKVDSIIDPSMPQNVNAILNVNNPLQIDPSLYTKFPVRLPITISVCFDDGTFGYVYYLIEDFDVANISLAGMEVDKYVLVLGKGSVAEKSFDIAVEVLGREIIPLKEMVDGNPTDMVCGGNIPVVDEISIDPYSYALKKVQNSLWNPLGNSVTLNFAPVSNLEQGERMMLENVVWDFDFNQIKYDGGNFFATAMFNQLPIAMKVSVIPKLVKELWVVDTINVHLPIDDRPFTEARGSYTVDVLESETYVFPTVSTEKQELRLYFEDNSYRIIVLSEAHSILDDVYYNTYLPLEMGIEWKHLAVPTTSLQLKGSLSPLGADIATNKAVLAVGEGNINIGVQNIELKVFMPSREAATIGYAPNENEYVITGYERLQNGEYDFSEPIYNYIDPTNATFYADKPFGSYFEYNPYNQMPLPNIVYLSVEQSRRQQTKGYKIQWIEDDVLYAKEVWDNDGNLLGNQYLLRHVSAERKLLLVRGIIGDGEYTLEVNMIVENMEAIYQGIIFEGLDQMATTKIIDPYETFELPSYYTLLLKNDEEIFVENAEWFIKLEDNQKWMFQLNGRNYEWVYDYLAYLDAINEGQMPSKTIDEIIPTGFSEPTLSEIEYYRLLMAVGEIPIDNRYVFKHQGGRYAIKSYTEATESIIAQEISLTLEIIPRTILVVDPSNNCTQIDFFNDDSLQPKAQFIVDTYQIESATLLERLDFLYRTNGEYEYTIRLFNNILSDIKTRYPYESEAQQYARSYDSFYVATVASERVILDQLYIRYNVSISEEELKYQVLQEYLIGKENLMKSMQVGLYFGDFASTSTKKYGLVVTWTNINEVISALISSKAELNTIILEGYIGYGQINEQLVRIIFQIYKREIESFNFHRMTDIDSSVMSIDYRYVYVANEMDALGLIDSIISSMDNSQSYVTAFENIYNHLSLTDFDRAIMEEVRDEIQGGDEEVRYLNILNEIRTRRLNNMRTIFITMDKPMGLSEIDQDGDKIFVAPSDYFHFVFSQVSLRFADETEGYYSPQFQIGDGETLYLQKTNFDSKLLATDPMVHHIEIDQQTGERYAYVDVVLSHLSVGSCQYPVTIRFKAVVDQKNTQGSMPSSSELEPYDANGNPRFLQGYSLPHKVTVEYEKSGKVIFGDIASWKLMSPLAGFEEEADISVIPVTNINVLNPLPIDLSINLPCGQGAYSYQINFPQKYIGQTRYNATAEDRGYRSLDIYDGVIEIENIYEIYEPSLPLGFDISKLPQSINPYQYANGEVQFELGDMLFDTEFDLTNNNSFDVEWRLVGDWLTGRKIDHTGTLVNVNGELKVEPILFAVAKVFSYYYTVEDSPTAILLEQEIELYIKIKPLHNPIIEYNGLVSINDNNEIGFDPYDDANNYGGNIVLPKDGLKVYFNNNLEDFHIFDARAELTYNLLMADISDKSRAKLLELLMDSVSTSNIERIEYQRLVITALIRQYADAMSIARDTASEELLAFAFDKLLEGENLNAIQREQQRKFFIDFLVDSLDGYGVNSLMAWQSLMQAYEDSGERTIILRDYLFAFQQFTQQDIEHNLNGLIRGYYTLNNLSLDDRKSVIFSLYDTLSNQQKAYIVDLLLDKGLYTQDINTALERISLEGIIIGSIDRKTEALNRVMNIVSSDDRLDILVRFIEEDDLAIQLSTNTGESLRNCSYALLYREIVIACYENSGLMNKLANVLAVTVDEWGQAMDSSVQRMWSVYLDSVVHRGNYNDILNLVELYISCSDTHTLERFKEIIVNGLINSYDFNNAHILQYFEQEGSAVGVRLLGVVISDIESEKLAEWRSSRAKSLVWSHISAEFVNSDILTRIIEMEENLSSSINYSLAYELLKQSDIYDIFSASVSDLEAVINNPDPTLRRAEIFAQLYQNSMLSRKKMLIEIMVQASYNIKDSTQAINFIPYTQAGHSVVQIEGNILYLYLYLPDGQRLGITLEIFSREIDKVLVANTITRPNGDSTQEILPNIYYIDPYNADTFLLPEKAEFVFRTGHNLVLDINEWSCEQEGVFSTREGQSTHKLCYYNLTDESYRGGSYALTAYLTYGRGALAEKQYFTIIVIVLNRTLEKEYISNYHFDNPIAGRVMDIPSSLSFDMFVDYDIYYRNIIPPQYYYSNFGQPVVPQINWHKTALNTDGILDDDIKVQGGFNEKDKMGFVSFPNNSITNTYQRIEQDIYEETAYRTKPIAWDNFFEISPAGEKVVKTVFAGVLAEQILTLDKQIINELRIEAYQRTAQYIEFPTVLDNVMTTFRNNNIGLYPEESLQWYILLFENLQNKAFMHLLSENETLVWNSLYSDYIYMQTSTINDKKVARWNQLLGMTNVFTQSQKNMALANLNQAYLTYRNSMLIEAWDRLERVVKADDALVMAEILNNLTNIYGSSEQAKLRAWSVLRYDDRIKYINGEKAFINITADTWSFIDLIENEQVLEEIIINEFTKTTNKTVYDAKFEVWNTVISDQIREILQELVTEYYDEFKHIALEQVRQLLANRVLAEMQEIIGNSDKDKWLALYDKREADAQWTIDYTRMAVEGEGITDIFARDTLVWQRLLEGAGEWLPVMNEVWQYITIEATILPVERYHYAVEQYAMYRKVILTQELADIYTTIYENALSDAWEDVLEDYMQFGGNLVYLQRLPYREVAKNAWNKLYQISTVTEQSTMLNNVYSIDPEEARLTYAWYRYYDTMQISNQSRVRLMDNLFNYYCGYVPQTDIYLGYGQVYIDIMNNPQAVNEDTASLVELFAYLNDIYADKCYEFVVAEFVERLRLVNPEVEILVQFYLGKLKADTWRYFYATMESENNNQQLSSLNSIISQYDTETLSWQKLYESKQEQALQAQDIIDQIFEQVVAEFKDKQLSQAYELQLSNDMQVLLEIRNNYAEEEQIKQIKLILWERLYGIVEPIEQTLMDTVLNAVVLESNFAGDDAKIESWDRLLNKRETSITTKNLMVDMMNTYLQARVFELYKNKKIEDSDNYVQHYIDSYKLSILWNDLYSQTNNTSQMDQMLNNMELQYPNLAEDVLKAYALKELYSIESINSWMEDIELVLSNAEILETKVREWDRVYDTANTSRRSTMQSMLANWETYPPNERKAYALDELLTMTLLTPTEILQVKENIQQEFEKLFELLEYEKAFEYLHNTDIVIIYNNIISRVSVLYPEKEMSIREIKKYAVQEYILFLRECVYGDIDNLLETALDSFKQEYGRIAWDRYYQYNLDNDNEIAESMVQILNSSVSVNISDLKVQAVDRLYDKVSNELKSSVRDAENAIIDTLTKQTVWAENVGEDIDTLKQTLNAILTIDDNDISLKGTAWQKMIVELATSIDINDYSNYNIMVALRARIYNENIGLADLQIDALAYDALLIEEPNIGIVLLEDYTYELKKNAWEDLVYYYRHKEMMTALLEEMYNAEMWNNNNNKKLSKVACWDKMVGLAEYIEQTLSSIDPRFSEQELRAFAIDCMLERLKGTERIVLLNAIDAVELSITSEQLNELVFDYIYTQNNVVMTQKYEEASYNKSLALQLYIQHIEQESVIVINTLSEQLFGTTFEYLNYSQKEYLYSKLLEIKNTKMVQAYILQKALDSLDSEDSDFARVNIFWDEQALDFTSNISKIYIGSAYKSYDAINGEIDINNMFVGENYVYRKRQIVVDYLDFYGELDLWSGNEIIGSQTYYNQLVIDPLNPYIPTSVDAYGTITGIQPDVEISNGVFKSYIGKIAIDFERDIYDFPYSYDRSGEVIKATVYPELGEETQKIMVQVFYLDRRPSEYFVNTRHYTNEQENEDLKLYPLSWDNVAGYSTMIIDPLNDKIYDTDQKKYMLPTSMVVMFTGFYAEELVTVLFMNDVFESRMDINNIQWNLLGGQITLKGAQPFNITIDSYSVGENEIQSQDGMGIDFWRIKLRVIAKNPERVLTVNEQGTGGILLANIKDNKLYASNKIDPYNPLELFSKYIRVDFLGGTESKLLSNVEWHFEEGRGLAYLQQEDVITGRLDENAMYLVAGFRCVSEMIWVRFPIQPRHIDTSDGMLMGGTLYLLKGMNINQQLAKYDKLYYNFTQFNQEVDWSEVPLEFDDISIAGININEVGTYELLGRLGPINDTNIRFVVKVIDPKLYAIDSGGNANKKVYYDSIAIAINNYGVRVNGKEDEEGFLPDSFVQFDAYNRYGNIVMDYQEFEIIHKVWDVANKKAIFTCQYVFLSEYDSDRLLASDSSLSRYMTFEIKIPLTTYVYTDIDEAMSLKTSTSGGISILHHILGEELLLSQLPKAIINEGESNQKEITLMWDLNNINVNKAGTYVLYGYYRDYTSSFLVKSKNLVVEISKFDISNEISTVESLQQVYDGLHINITPSLPSVLRDNGTYAQLRIGREIIVEYITLEKYLMGEYSEFRTTPYRNAGDYKVRITVVDYNITGQIILDLIILPITIDINQIGFEYGSSATLISMNIPNWPKTQLEKDSLYFNQFKNLVYARLGESVVIRIKARTYDVLFNSLSEEGRAFLSVRYDSLLSATYEDFNQASTQAQTNMSRNIKAIIWDRLSPIGMRMEGIEEDRLIPQWPINTSEKATLILNAKLQFSQEGIEYTDNMAIARAYDNLYNDVADFVQVIMISKLNNVLATKFLDYEYASEAMRSAMRMEAKTIVWQEIMLTGFADMPLIENWPISLEKKETLINTQYDYIITLPEFDINVESFKKDAKTMAYDDLYNKVYSTAKLKLEEILSIYGAKYLVWENLRPNDTVQESSYIYDGNEHMPIVIGLPQASIANWPQSESQKNDLLEYAQSENVRFTQEQARARAFDNLMEAVYTNSSALQKMNNILSEILHTKYPSYYDLNLSAELRQQLLITAKSEAWRDKIIPADTVQEIQCSFLYWYSNMNGEGIDIISRPKDAGTYEITLIIDPTINTNYVLSSSTPIVVTISIRKGDMVQSFVEEMQYTGQPLLPKLDDGNESLPNGVSVQYSFRKENGQAVDYIRDVGLYTFSAIVDGGNNYPSWTVQEQYFRITKKELIIDVGTVETGYLEELKPFNSGITIEGIVGSDRASMFGYLVCSSDVTSKHMVGEYDISFVGFKQSINDEKIYTIGAEIFNDNVLRMDGVLFGNYNITVINGIYKIKKADEQAIIINSITQMQEEYQQLQEGQTAIWYISPNVTSYGDLVINKKVGLTIIGCYDTNIQNNDYSHLENEHDKKMSGVKDDALSIVTVFDSITVNAGAVSLDIVRVNGRINGSAVSVGRNATSITIRRSILIYQEQEGGENNPQNAIAIITDVSFNGLLRLESTYIKGFTLGVGINAGRKLEIINCRFTENNIGVLVHSAGGDVHIEKSRFEFCLDKALSLAKRNFIVVNSSFYSNEKAICSLIESIYEYELRLENVFGKNVYDISSL